ncbi:DnaJ protein P58IPK homolog, partial [Geodia barretti]
MGLTREEALKIMGLEEGCSTKEVRDRFKKLALKWHPDKNIDNPDDAQKKFQAISAAYTKLVSSDSEEEDDDIPNVSSSLSCVAACHSPIHSYIAAGQGIWLSS